MAPRSRVPRRDAFISHASVDIEAARTIERALEADGMNAWLDDSEIQLGVLLAGELQSAIRDCRVLVLLWSQTAARSRWVNTEWLAAHHLDRFIVPCVLDDTPLPQCFEHSVYLDLRRGRDAAVARLVKAVRAARLGANPLPPPVRAESRELRDAIHRLGNGQRIVTDALGSRDVKQAADEQTALEEVMRAALAAWPLDPMVVMLDGYHIKNDYMIRHWEALQSGRGPADPALERSERRFFEALALDPTEPSGLDGLGSILMLRRDLRAAEFFFQCAIRQAEVRGFRYDAAIDNLASVRRFLDPQAAAPPAARRAQRRTTRSTTSPAPPRKRRRQR
jgi:hypothetical protein